MPPEMIEPLFLLGAVAAFALLHVALFAFTRERSSLYLGIATTGFLVLGGAEVVRSLAGDAPGDWLVRALAPLANTAGIVVGLSSLRFAYAFFDLPVTRVFRVLLVVGVVLSAWMWISPRPDTAPPPVVMVLALATVVEILRAVVLAFLRRRPGTRSVGLGFVVLGTTGGLQALTVLGVLPFRGVSFFTYGMIFLLLVLTVSVARRFADTSRDLERQRRRGRELDRARRLQRSFLPATIEAPPGWRVEAAMATATEVGGDYYDYRAEPRAEHEGGGDGVIVAVGDATGHGMDSGLIVAAAKSLFQSATPGAAPAEILEAVSRGITGLGLRRMNMAMVLAHLEAAGDGAPGRATLTAGGMPPPLLFRAANGEVEEIRLDAPPLGAMRLLRPAARPVSTVELAPGDVLLLYTDGLPEAADPDDHPFSYERLAERFAALAALAALAADGDRSPIEGLLAEAESWAGGRAQEDDITLVAIFRTS